MVKGKIFKIAAAVLCSIIILGQAFVFAEEAVITEGTVAETEAEPKNEAVTETELVPVIEAEIVTEPETTTEAITETITENEIFTSYSFYTGNVYLMNDENCSVIFRNVKKSNSFGVGEFALDLEYSDLSIIKDNIFSADGKKLSFDEINTYLLDQKVEFLVAKNSHKIKVIYMEFCE